MLKGCRTSRDGDFTNLSMCGICCVQRAAGCSDLHCAALAIEGLPIIKRRGPHWCEIRSVNDRISLTASVLHLRGTELCKQPIADDAGNVLLWNGEVHALGLNALTLHPTRHRTLSRRYHTGLRRLGYTAGQERHTLSPATACESYCTAVMQRPCQR